MGIFLFLLSSIFFAILFVFWRKRCQRKTGEMSSNSTCLVLTKPSSSESSMSHTDKNLSINNLSQDILNNFPHSVAMQKRILVNLRIVEYKLAELEHFLVIRGLNGAVVNQPSTEKLT